MVSATWQAREAAVIKEWLVNIDYSEGMQFLTEDEIDAEIQAFFEEGNSLKMNEINISMLEERLRSLEYVERAEVYSTIESELRVDVYQRKPLVRVHAEDEQYYLTERGLKFPLHPEFSARVPLVSGKIDPEQWSDVLGLMQVIQEDSLLSAQIVEIERKENGKYWLYPRLGNHTIRWGNLENGKEKARKLKKFYKEIIRKTGADYYKSIDLSFDDQVVASKR